MLLENEITPTLRTVGGGYITRVYTTARNRFISRLLLVLRYRFLNPLHFFLGRSRSADRHRLPHLTAQTKDIYIDREPRRLLFASNVAKVTTRVIS